MCQNAIYICISWYSKIFWFPTKNADVSRTEGVYHLIHIFLDLLYNYAKFHHCRICVTDFRLYGPPSVSSPEKTPPWIGLKNHQKRSFCCHWDYYQLSHYQFSHYLSMDYRMMASSVLCSNHKKKLT